MPIVSAKTSNAAHPSSQPHPVMSSNGRARTTRPSLVETTGSHLPLHHRTGSRPSITAVVPSSLRSIRLKLCFRDSEALPGSPCRSRSSPINRAAPSLSTLSVSPSLASSSSASSSPPAAAASARSSHSILSSASGCIRPGAFCALLGQSGAGKTTLLNCLAGRVPSGVRSGEVRIDGRVREEGSSYYATHCGYVSQQSLLLPALTPRESIAFASHMKLPAGTAEAEHAANVNRIIAVSSSTLVAA